MKVLFVTDQFPYPLDGGGNIRTFHILRGLASRYDVTLVSHEPQCKQYESESPVHDLCNVILASKPPTLKRSLGNLLRLRSSSLFLMKNWSSSLQHAAESELANGRYEILHWNMLDTACMSVGRETSLINVVDSHNCLYSMAKTKSKQAKHLFTRLLWQHEFKALRKWEGAVCDAATVTLACSGSDSRLFSDVSNDSNCLVIPNGVDCEYFRPNSEETATPGTLLFTGTMNYEPNEEAALWFAEQVMPILRHNGCDTRTVFVGRNPTKRLLEIADGKNLVVTGSVPDVRPYFGSSEIFIVPLLSGGGTRLKILEAFAMTKAVVSTSKGAEGLKVSHNENILISDDPVSFARSIMELMRTKKLRERLATNARKLSLTHYDWSVVQQDLLRIYSQIGPF